MNKSNKAKTQKPTRANSSRGAKSESEKSQKHKRAQSQSVAGGRKATVRDGGKLASVIVMLRRPKGASIEDLCKATGWQAHSVRGAISGAIKKKIGLTITSTKTDGKRTYRVTN